MSDFNKGDFTQQGVDGHVRATLRLNEKRYVELDLTTNENARGCTISGNVHDRLNNLDYPIGAAPSGNIEITENTAEGEPLDVSQYATATVNVSGGGSDWTTAQLTLKPTTDTEHFIIAEYVSTNAPVLYNENYETLDTVTLTNDGIIVEIPLYKGTASYLLDSFIPSAAIRETEPNVYVADITGDCSFDGENLIATITGDCIIGLGFQK